MKKLITTSILALSMSLTGCVSTQEDLDHHYAKVKSVCKVDPRTIGKRWVFGIGMTNECLKFQYGSAYKSNTSVGSYGVHEQRIYNDTIRFTYNLPKYVYLKDGIVTSYQF